MKSVFKLNLNFKKVITQEAMEFDDLEIYLGIKYLKWKKKNS